MSKPWLTTTEFADRVKARQQTVYNHLAKGGSYYGIRPERLPSGRLAWPSNVEELLRAAVQPGAQ
jgi:hypothetical protein